MSGGVLSCHLDDPIMNYYQSLGDCDMQPNDRTLYV